MGQVSEKVDAWIDKYHDGEATSIGISCLDGGDYNASMENTSGIAGEASTAREGIPYAIRGPPFFELLAFINHTNLCWAFRKRIRLKGKQHFESLVQVCCNKGTSRKKDLEPLYGNAKPLITFIKQVMQRVGLQCRGGKEGRQYVYRVWSPQFGISPWQCVCEKPALLLSRPYMQRQTMPHLGVGRNMLSGQDVSQRL